MEIFCCSHWSLLDKMHLISHVKCYKNGNIQAADKMRPAKLPLGFLTITKYNKTSSVTGAKTGPLSLELGIKQRH